MNETESTKVDQETDQQEVCQRPWRRVWSAPWLFTFALVIVQLLTFSFVFNPMPSLGVYVFVGAGLSLAAVVPVWCVAIWHWASLLLGLVVLFFEGITFGYWVPGPPLEMFLMPVLVGGTVAIPLLGICLFWGRFDKPMGGVDTVQFQEGLRFGIRHLFIASAVVAAICGIGKALASYFVLTLGSQTYFLAFIIVVISFNTLMSTWALMGRSVSLRIVISFLLAVLSCVGGSLVFPGGVILAILFLSLIHI